MGNPKDRKMEIRKVIRTPSVGKRERGLESVRERGERGKGGRRTQGRKARADTR